MRFEALVGAWCAGALATSTAMEAARRGVEARRRRGPAGTQLLPDRRGGSVEYLVSGPADGGDIPLVVCESGLGAPLEGWDWIAQELHADARVLRYHRPGYLRTTSRQPPAALVEALADVLAPRSPVCFVSHSIGALVTANLLRDSPILRERTVAVYLIDATVGELLARARESAEETSRLVQTSIQEGLAAWTGLARWTDVKPEVDANYRASVQRSFMIASSSPRTLLTAYREYRNEPVAGQRWLSGLDVPKHVVAADDNRNQQRDLARSIGADYSFVPGSNHRSIIGKLTYARIVAGLVREGLR